MSHKQPISTFLGIAAGLLLASNGFAAIINVPGDFATIQAAIDDAETVDGDEIVVAVGTYNEAINLAGKAITLRSTDPSDPDVVAATIIDGTGLGQVSVVTCDSQEGLGTVLEGFTITGGTGAAEGSHTHGGGMTIGNSSSPTVINCRFTDNMTVGSIGGGGGIFVEGASSSPMVINCTFSGNEMTGNGGGMYLFGNSSAEVINCTFSGNEVGGNGGGMYLLNNSSAEVINCTFSGNTAGTAGSLWSETGSTATLTNCIFWNVGIDEIVGSGITVSYSDVQGGFSGIGNIDADPLFIDPLNGDFHLLPFSPCIDAADNTAVPPGITTDLDGNSRFVDDPNTPDTGNPDGVNPIVDMGVYEFQPPCPEDINGDGSINVLELIDLLLCFGQPAIPGCVGEDINNDGTVNVLDLVQLLLAFGTTCQVTEANFCAGRVTIGDGLTPFTTVGATTDGAPTNGLGSCSLGSQVHQDIWYNYTASATGTLTVSTCNDGNPATGSATYDTKIAIYDGCDTANCPFGGNEIGCNDDLLGCAAFSSSAVAPVAAGNCYKIRVGGFDVGFSGTGNLAVSVGP